MTARDDAIARLTEAQREVLRLVMTGHQSKEIALQLGIGVDAVNKRLAAAKSLLGAPTRFAAARWLADHEAAGRTPPPQPVPVPVPAAAAASHSLVGQPLAVGETAPRPDHAGQDAIGNLPHDTDHPNRHSQPAFSLEPGPQHAVGDVRRPYGGTVPAGPARPPGLGQWLDQQLAGVLATPGRVFAAALLIGAAAALARHL